MPTPNSPAIVGLWTRTQCDGTTAFHVPVFVPRPPSPRIPDPTTVVIDLALSARPSPPTSSESWDDGEEQHCPPVGVHHMLDASSPLSIPSIPSPPPPHLAQGTLEVCSSDAIVVIVRKV